MGKKRQRAIQRKSTEPIRRSAYQMTAEQTEQDLVTGRNAKLLQEYFGEATYEELRTLARESKRAPLTGTRVLILPGIMGSQLGTRDDVIWVDPFDIRKGKLIELALGNSPPRIGSLGVIPIAYFLLKFRLRWAGHDADFFDYDWRQSLDGLGAKLAQSIQDDAAGRLSLVAHSMGGLVARAALRKAGRKVDRLIMLGTPNFGSFMPIQAMRGTYSLLQRVAAFDKQHSAEELARRAVVTWEGLCQMLPVPEKFTGIDLYDAGSWPAKLPVPSQTLLDNARRVQKLLPQNEERCFLIAGVNQYTVTGLRSENGEFIERLSRAGDGTVPLDLALLDGAKTYYVEESHGSLQNNRLVAQAVIDLLDHGEPGLPTEWNPPRELLLDENPESENLTAAPPTRDVEDATLDELRNLVQEVAAPPKLEDIAVAPAAPAGERTVSLKNVIIARRMQHRIDVRLALGNITEVSSRAIVLGIFRDVAPSGPALALNQRLGNAITEFTQRRMFSANVGEIFIMPTPRHGLRTEMILLVGLGAFDSFNDSVQQVVAENTVRTLIRTGVHEFATVVMGSRSGSGIGQSLESLLSGFVRGLTDTDMEHQFRSLTLCELNEERCAEIRQELYRLASTSLFGNVEVVFDEFKLPETAPAAVSRAVSVPPEEGDPVYLIVRQDSTPSPSNSKTNGPASVEPSDVLNCRASLLTAGGKATVISDVQQVQKAELDALLLKIESPSFIFSRMEKFGSDLANMMLPSTVIEALSNPAFNGIRKRQLVIVSDAPMSRIPWETIQLGDQFPAVDRGLSRRYFAENLSVAKWLEERRQRAKLAILLVVNPTQDLAGADAEGQRLDELFKDNDRIDVTRIEHQQATSTRLAAEFNSGKYDVVHYAGHAFFDERTRSRSGILCADDRVLSGAELAVLSRLPSLVFFNACEAARVRRRGRGAAQKKGPPIRERIDRNVSFAEAYLRGGVANYIGTYWPVGDEAAKEFADTFYTEILKGQTVGKALMLSRKAVQAIKSVDWADYIHYGNHDFRLKVK